MNHFELKGGELSLRGRALSPTSPRRWARRSMSIPPPPWSGTTRCCATPWSRPGLGDPLIAFAVKANSNVAVLRTLANLGAGADTVSEGEIRRALAAGVPPERIVFSGVGKTEARSPSPSRPASPRSTSSPSPSCDLVNQRRPADGQARDDRHPGEPRRRGRRPRQDLHRQGREQVRRLVLRGRAPLRQRLQHGRPQTRSASPATSAARSPTSPPCEAAFAKMRGLVERPARPRA